MRLHRRCAEPDGFSHFLTIRAATAVVHCNRGVWGTGSRLLFNVNPRDAVERLIGQFELFGRSTS